MLYSLDGNRITVDREELDIRNTLDSGQLFRYRDLDEERYILHSGPRYVILEQLPDISVITPSEDTDIKYWIRYFDLELSYKDIMIDLCGSDKKLSEMYDEFKGIRILNQDLYETIISFIISQNNNIPRIKKIIDNICTGYGKEIAKEGLSYHAFPERDEMLQISIEDYYSMGLGYRSEYLYKTTRDLTEEYLEELKFSDDQDGMLLKLYGIGPKVKNCIKLFALHDLKSYPIDTWIKKVLSDIYGVDNKKDIDELVAGYGKYAGIAQQYQFFYARQHKV